MSIEEEIMRILRVEGFRTNDVTRDALNEFIEAVVEVHEELTDDGDEDEGGDEEDD